MEDPVAPFSVRLSNLLADQTEFLIANGHPDALRYTIPQTIGMCKIAYKRKAQEANGALRDRLSIAAITTGVMSKEYADEIYDYVERLREENG